jgi:hypothetical protein
VTPIIGGSAGDVVMWCVLVGGAWFGVSLLLAVRR